MTSSPLKLGFLASKNGTSMRAIVDAARTGALPAEPRLVVSNNRKAAALEFAAERGVPSLVIPTQSDPAAADAELAAAVSLVLAAAALDAAAFFEESAEASEASAASALAFAC